MFIFALETQVSFSFASSPPVFCWTALKPSVFLILKVCLKSPFETVDINLLETAEVFTWGCDDTHLCFPWHRTIYLCRNFYNSHEKIRPVLQYGYLNVSCFQLYYIHARCKSCRKFKPDFYKNTEKVSSSTVRVRVSLGLGSGVEFIKIQIKYWEALWHDHNHNCQCEASRQLWQTRMTTVLVCCIHFLKYQTFNLNPCRDWNNLANA